MLGTHKCMRAILFTIQKYGDVMIFSNKLFFVMHTPYYLYIGSKLRYFVHDLHLTLKSWNMISMIAIFSYCKGMKIREGRLVLANTYFIDKIYIQVFSPGSRNMRFKDNLNYYLLLDL